MSLNRFLLSAFYACSIIFFATGFYAGRYSAFLQATGGEQAAAARPSRPLIPALAAAAALAGGTALGVAKMRGMSLRVKRLASLGDRLAQGDLTDRVEVTGKDELARLGADMNTGLDAVRETLRSVVSGVRSLSKTGTGLKSSAELTTSSITEISKLVEKSRSKNEQLVAGAEETAAVVEQMDQASMVDQSSTSVDEIMRSLDATTNEAGEAREQLQALIRNSEAGREALDQQDALVSEMADAGRSLREANELTGWSTAASTIAAALS